MEVGSPLSQTHQQWMWMFSLSNALAGIPYGRWPACVVASGEWCSLCRSVVEDGSARRGDWCPCVVDRRQSAKPMSWAYVSGVLSIAAVPNAFS